MVIVIATALATSLLEYLGILMDRVQYGNEWNIVFTFLSYLIAYILVYIYYRMIAGKYALIRPPD